VLNIVGTVICPGASSLDSFLAGPARVRCPLQFRVTISMATDPARQPLPGLAYNCLNAGCGKSDLEAAVGRWNSTIAGTLDKSPSPKKFPTIALPANYSLGPELRFAGYPADQDLSGSRNATSSPFSVKCSTFETTRNYGGFNFNPTAGTPAGSAFGIATQRQRPDFGSGARLATAIIWG